MSKLKIPSLDPVKLIAAVILYSLLPGCGAVPYAYLTKEENPYNYPQYDYFVEKGYNRLKDFDLRGNVKSMVQYKPTQNPLATKKSLDFDASFTPEGFLDTHSRYHTGAFFFHGKKEIEIKVVYNKQEKKLVEKHVMGDSTSVKYINTYDKHGNLVTTEDELSMRRYVYDSKERVIKEEFYRKDEADLYNVPTNTHVFEFDDKNRKVKTRVLEAQQQDNQLFQNTYHEFFYYDSFGNLEKRQITTRNDTITYRYNSNRQLTEDVHTRSGSPIRESKYFYDEKDRIREEVDFRQGRLFQRHTYDYDHKDYLIKKASYDNSRQLTEILYEYTYDANDNWISRTTVLKDFLGNEVYEQGTVTREIEYY